MKLLALKKGSTNGLQNRLSFLHRSVAKVIVHIRASEREKIVGVKIALDTGEHLRIASTTIQREYRYVPGCNHVPVV